MKTLEQVLDGNVQTVINALRAAADQYSADATKFFDAGLDRSGQQFRAQQAEVIRLADELEETGAL